MSYATNVPDFKLMLGDKDLTPKVRPRLISLTLTDKRAGEADQLEIELDDSDGGLALPRLGATLTLQLGWKAGSEVELGLINKGSFKVDSVAHAGAPDKVTISASAADFNSQIRTRREKSWRNTTIGAVVADVAARNKLTPRCAAALAALPVKALAQSRESDLALLRRLGREHDAVATVKAGALVFAPIGAGTTATGAAIPGATIVRRQGDKHNFSMEKKEESEGVSAAYHDRKAAKTKVVHAGKPDKAKRLARTYHTESAAKRAARSEHGRQQRAGAKFSFELALGRADLYPERKTRVQGFKPEIDATPWLIVEVVHTLGQGGYTTSLQMERAA
ncbi:MAG TPA: contractile injection system protein, VgrG/Pvc8 family [Allosphingosinicella sp.]|jgi:hypothetical protein